MKIKSMVFLAAGALVAGKAAEVVIGNFGDQQSVEIAQTQPVQTEHMPLLLETAAEDNVQAPSAQLLDEMAEPIGYETSQPAIVHDALPELLTALAAEQELLHLRSDELDAREAQLELTKAALGEQITQLESLEARIQELVGSAESNQNEDIFRLVRIYTAMKPNQAGAIMDELDIEVTVMVLAAMQESVAGPILASMSPVRAQAVSKIIFERSRLPGNQNLVNVQLN